MKNYKKMTSAALKKELEIATAKEQVEIKNVLTARGIEVESAEQTQETAEETAEKPASDAAETKKKKEPISDEELEKIKESCKENVNHRCEVVPFNTIEWAKGYIVGLIVDKRSRKVLYAIKLDDGRRIVKAVDSKLIKISEEKREFTARTNAAAKLSEEEFEAKYAEMLKIVGAEVEVGESKGRITSIVKNLKQMKLLYCITLEDGKKSFKSHNTDFSGAELDDEGKELNEKYIAKLPKELTTEEKIEQATARVEALKLQLEKAEKHLAELKEKAGEDLI